MFGCALLVCGAISADELTTRTSLMAALFPCRKPNRGENRYSTMDIEKLRREAEDCRRESERSSDPADKEFWSRIAKGWIELLEKVEGHKAT